MKHQGVEIRHLEAENKDLKARIERQEAFHKRRMEKEKKEKRGIRSGSSTRTPTMGGNGSTASGEGGRAGREEEGRRDGSQARFVFLACYSFMTATSKYMTAVDGAIIFKK